jgi:hypothetical protein
VSWASERRNWLASAARRDPAAVLPENVEVALLTALDNETDARIAAQIKATLRTLLREGAPSQPSRWLAVCADVALAAGPSTMTRLGEVSTASASVQPVPVGVSLCALRCRPPVVEAVQRSWAGQWDSRSQHQNWRRAQRCPPALRAGGDQATGDGEGGRWDDDGDDEGGGEAAAPAPAPEPASAAQGDEGKPAWGAASLRMSAMTTPRWAALSVDLSVRHCEPEQLTTP